MPLISFICCPRYQNQCCVSNIGGWSFPYFLTIAFFWDFPLKSPQLTFLFGGFLKVDFQSSLPQASRWTISDPTFWLPHLLSFPLNWWIPTCQAERTSATFLHGSLSWVPRGIRLLFYQVLISNSSALILSKSEAANGTCLSSFLMSRGMLSLSCPNPGWLFPAFPDDLLGSGSSKVSWSSLFLGSLGDSSQRLVELPFSFFFLF